MIACARSRSVLVRLARRACDNASRTPCKYVECAGTRRRSGPRESCRSRATRSVRSVNVEQHEESRRPPADFCARDDTQFPSALSGVIFMFDRQDTISCHPKGVFIDAASEMASTWKSCLSFRCVTIELSGIPLLMRSRDVGEFFPG